MNVFKAMLIHGTVGTAFFVGSGALVSGLAGHGWTINPDLLFASVFDTVFTVISYVASIALSVFGGMWIKLFNDANKD